MLAQTATRVAARWPLNIVLDNVLGSHTLAPWLKDLLPRIKSGGDRMVDAGKTRCQYGNGVRDKALYRIPGFLPEYPPLTLVVWGKNDFVFPPEEATLRT